MKLLAVTCLLFVAAHAQFVPGPAPNCNQIDVNGGAIHLPHEKYCQLFYRCDTGLTRWEMQCGANTLFDPNLQTCNYPTSNKCANWVCDQNRVGTNYPDVCCNKYWTCNGEGFIEQECPAGQEFDFSFGQCRTTNQANCQDHPFCRRFASSVTGVAQCSDIRNEDGNPCLYTTIIPGFTIRNRQCAAGTAFNATACQCSIFDTSCGQPQENVDLNKALDSQCRASMRTDFSQFPFRTFSDKLNRQQLPYAFEAVGATVFNGQAQLSGSNSYLYNYFFNNNQLATPLAIAVAFRYPSPTDGATVQILRNQYLPASSLCGPPTFEVTGTYSSFTGWTVNLRASGSNGADDTVTASIQINPNNFLEVLVTYSQVLSLQLIDRGTTVGTQANSVQSASGTRNLGEYLAYSRCGMTIGGGLNGEIRKFNVYEGCGDFSIVRA